jgi:putative phage-type endonuclease
MRELSGGQQGDQWHEHRLGRVTASRMKDLMAYSKQEKRRGVALQARIDYAWELMAERTTRREVKNKPPNAAMQWGIDNEPFALALFEKTCNVFIMPVGFVLHPRFDFAGASPDGVTEDAIIEVKCPESTNYLKWRHAEGVPEEHRDQMYWQMACTGRRKGIFIGFDPRQPEGKRIFFRDLPWNQERIDELEAEAQKINDEIGEMLRVDGFAPTEWLIEDGELALPSKYAKKRKFVRELETAVLATELSEADEYAAAIKEITEGVSLTP